MSIDYSNSNYYYYYIIMKMFVDAFGAMGHVCMDNIRQVKRQPEKIVIEVEVK